MTPVSAARPANRMAPLASLDCSITDSRLSMVDTPSLNSYFECDQLSDMVDDSLFEITNTGCLSSSVFQRPELTPDQAQQFPSFLYSSYDYSASSRIPIAAQTSSRYRISTHNNNYHNNYQCNNATPNQTNRTEHPTLKLGSHRIASSAKSHSKLNKTELKHINDNTAPVKDQSHSAGVSKSKKSPDSKKSRLGIGSILGGFFDGHSKEVNRDKNTPVKSTHNNSTSNDTTGRTLDIPTSSVKARDSIRVTNQRLRKSREPSNNSHSLTTSRSYNDFRSNCSSFKPRSSEVLLLDHSRTLQRPISATQLPQTGGYYIDPQLQAKPTTKIQPQQCTPTNLSNQQNLPIRPTKSVKFCMMDQVLTRPASSKPRPLASEGVHPASIIKRTTTVSKSSTCSQTESSKNLDQLLAEYDKNTDLIREISEKLLLTDTITSPRSILDAIQPNQEEKETNERDMHALPGVYKSDLNLKEESTLMGGNDFHKDQLNNNKQRAFM